MKPIFLLLVLVSSITLSQENKALTISFSGFAETYYSYDFNNPNTDAKLPFMYNYNRHNEFNINIGLLRTKVEYENAYASLTFHAGTYVEDNYANESTKIINEAFVGLYLDTDRKHTLEVGILPSYIGFETAVSHNNLTLTRSILAENSPYFMTGVKYNYKSSEKWNYTFFITNGWQRISKPQQDVVPAIGTQVVFKSDENTTLNWSTFIGKEFNGTDYSMRYFSNIYYDKKWNDKWRTIAGFDYGWQNNSWFSPVLITQYSITSKWQTAGRVEYYADNNNVLIATNDPFKTLGFSLNFDYLPNSKVKLRTEARFLNSEEKLFETNAEPVNANFFWTTSLSFEF